MRRQWEKSTAPCSTTKGFTSSVGWIWIGPSTSQRLAPFTVLPTTRVAATSSSPTSRPRLPQCSQRRMLVRIASQNSPQLATSQISWRLT